METGVDRRIKQKVLKIRTAVFKKGVLPMMLPLLSFFVGIAQRPIEKITGQDAGWVIRTKSSAYRLVISSDKRIYPVFYGPLEQADVRFRNASWTQRTEEIPVRGAHPNKAPVLEVVYADNVRDADLELLSSEVVIIDKRPTLKIVQKDRLYPLQITSYIRVLEEFNILEKWVELTNLGKKGNIKVENLLSGSILLPNDEYVLTHLSGGELSEFQEYHTELTPGVKILETKMFKSNTAMPWFLVRPKSSVQNDRGPAWWGSVHYSGNWKLVFDNTFNSSYYNTLQILGGINSWDTELTLQPGRSFTTPKFSTGYSPNGWDGAARDNAAYVRETILPATHRQELRPVLFNSWYATTYNIKEEEQIAMAKIAKDIGVELFCLDDGWFKGRIKSDTALGDWDIDEVKFPNGLGPIIDSIHAMGMKFGLWVEPENVVAKSEVYHKHPDWVLDFPGRRIVTGRRFMNLAREDVYQYLFKSFDRLLNENKIDFIKWDQNTYLSDPGWADAPVEIQREVRPRFIANLYRLVDELRKRHPHVLFESCASGGGRVDLGMMSRMDQAWTSDNTTPVDRLFIQYGYLGAMPANTMVSWVIEGIANQQQMNASLAYKFDVAMGGVLGIGYDIRKWSAQEKEIARKKIALYKTIRPIVQQGITHRLVSPYEHNRTALQYNSKNGNEAVLFCYNLAVYLSAGYVKSAPLRSAQLNDRATSFLKLKDLAPDKNYRIQKADDPNDKGVVYTGAFLTEVGIDWPLKNSFESAIYTLKAE